MEQKGGPECKKDGLEETAIQIEKKQGRKTGGAETAYGVTLLFYCKTLLF